MYGTLQSWVKGTDRLAGLEVTIGSGAERTYTLVLIRNQSGIISIEQKQTSTLLKDVLPFIPKGIFIALTVNGKGLIHRATAIPPLQIEESLRSVFPDINRKDIYLQCTPTVSGSIVSLIRKDTVAPLLSELKEAGLHVAELALGPFLSQRFLNIAGLLPQELIFETYKLISRLDGTLEQYSISEIGPARIKISDGELEGSYLNAYAHACLLLLKHTLNISYPSSSDEQFEASEKKVKTALFQKRAGVVVLGISFIILLANFFAYSSFKNKNSEMQNKLLVFQHQLKQLDSLEKFVETKQDFLQTAGWADQTRLSESCDKIAQSVPTEVTLSELTFHPNNVNLSRKDKQITFDHNKLLIKGWCKHITVLNEWLKLLTTVDGVTNMKMDDYHYDTNKESGSFIIEGTIQQQ